MFYRFPAHFRPKPDAATHSSLKQYSSDSQTNAYLPIATAAARYGLNANDPPFSSATGGPLKNPSAQHPQHSRIRCNLRYHDGGAYGGGQEGLTKSTHSATAKHPVLGRPARPLRCAAPATHPERRIHTRRSRSAPYLACTRAISCVPAYPAPRFWWAAPRLHRRACARGMDLFWPEK